MKRIMTLLLVVLTSLILTAQNEVNCLVTDLDTVSLSGSPCFDVNSVMENCLTVYLKVNLHFFLEDDCSGNLGAGPRQTENDPNDVYQLAEDLINDSNDFIQQMNDNETHQWNQNPNGATVTGHQCLPLEIVLAGVYIHCDSDAKETEGLSFAEVDPYKVNSTSEVNVFITNSCRGSAPDPCNTKGEGFANNFLNKLQMEELTPSLFLHELGHVLNLAHSWDQDDGCPDTWQHTWTWDADGDGNIDDRATDKNSPNWQCRNGTEAEWNGEDACDTQLFSTEHPCCDFNMHQDNNLMTYTKWKSNPQYSALTPCQIERMLDDLSENMCDYVTQVGGPCAPPSAFIAIPLEEVYSQNYGTLCFNLFASYNETAYRLKFYKIENGTEILIKNTGWISGDAQTYCIQKCPYGPNSNEWPGGFEPNSDYKVVFTVKNDCNTEDDEELLFSTGDNECIEVTSNEPVIGGLISPNPASSQITISYEVEVSGSIDIIAIFPNTGQITVIDSKPNESIGNSSSSYNISSWQDGIHYAYLLHDDNYYISLGSLVKQ